ncbi:MAG TPA: hypothetical protein VGP94_00215 [Tepidisphaeraceae bacterium]|nr:hypothetical protein [Tepidisphaeraceae bacterium]
MRTTSIFTLIALFLLVMGCEHNANVRVASQPVLLSSPPETSLTSTGTLNTSTQEVREAILAVAKDLNMAVLQAPPPGVEGEALLTAPSGNPIRVHFKEVAPRRIELTVRRDTTNIDEQIDSLTRRVFDSVRDRALSGDPTGPR